MLKRKLIYTAITRAKKILILIGDVQIMQQGIRKIENNRKTILKNKLIEYINSDFDEMNKNQSIKRIIEEDEDELGSIFSELKESDFDNFNS